MDRARIRRLRPYLTFLCTLVVLVVGAYAAISLLEVNTLLERLRAADRRLLVLAAVVSAIGWPLRGWRYRDTLREMGAREGIGFLTLTVVMSQTANLVVPARAGDGVRAVLLKDRAEVPISTGIASVIVERLLDVLAVLLLLGAAVLWLTVRGVDIGVGVPWSGATVGIALASLALAVLVATRYAGWRRLRWPQWIPPSIRRWTSRVGRAIYSIRRPRLLGWLTIASVVVWTVDVLVAGVVAVAVLGADGPVVSGIGFAAITVAVAGGNLAKSVPLTQGGIGIYETAVAGLLVVSLPVSAEAALTIAVLDHAVKNGVTVLGGVGGSLWMNLQPFTREHVTNR